MNNTLNNKDAIHADQINEVDNEQQYEVIKRKNRQKWYKRNKEKRREYSRKW